VLHTARCKYRTQKDRHLCTIAQLCRAISSQLRHVLTVGKKLNSNISFTMVNFGLLPAEICWRPCKFQWVSRLSSVTARHSTCGRQPNFAALNRERHLYSAGRPSRWALAHICSLQIMTVLYGEDFCLSHF